MAERRTGDAEFMRRAIEVARRGWGTTHPNPMVGSLIVDGHKIVSEGYHARAGKAHAEVLALENLKASVTETMVLYCTLEPCSTQGRTPACTDRILESGIKRVVVGAIDPDLRHRGLGIKMLRYAGVEVKTGVLEEECEDLNLIFNHWTNHRGPLIAGKAACTLDGRIATRRNRSQWITGRSARRDVMRWRRLFPSIAVGAGTVMADNPRLTSRLDGEQWCPIRFVFDSRLSTVRDPMPALYTDESREHTIIITGPQVDPEKKKCLVDHGIKGWILDDGEDGRPSLNAFRRRCHEDGIEGVFCEGGGHLLSGFLASGELDYLFCYHGAKFLADEDAPGLFSGQCPGEISEGWRLSNVQHAVFGDDILTRGFLRYPASSREGEKKTMAMP